MSEAAQSDERAAEIWSTRIQQELLALTTDDAEASERTKAMLPPFMSLRDHHLDITAAACKVNFQVNVKESTGVIVVSLDASLPKKSDGSIATGVPTYPFVAPVATLSAGAGYFPNGSTIKNGDRIGMDIEWTPSLHLADAVMNIGLKIKECLLQKEPFHPSRADDGDDVSKKASRIASSLSSKASSFGKAFSTKSRKSSKKDKSKKAPKHDNVNRMKKSSGSPDDKGKSKTSGKSVTSPENVRIGDEICLLDEPWVEAHGVYACKAIRRPDFIAEAMEAAEQKAEQQSFSSPTAMFRSFTKSARNVLQESFLMITDTHIIEMTSSKLNPTIATVTFCIAIELMHKLKFRRHESLSLFFKPAPEDPMIYMCPDSGDAVHQIQAVLKRHGVKGKHTNAAAHRAISEAMQLVQEIQTKELALKHDPSVNRVNEIMDLYRQAAERFEVAGDIRHEEVVTHMRKFLALPLTTSILDGSYQKPAGSPKPPSPSRGDKPPEGEVLPRSQYQLDDEDLDGPTPKKKGKEKDNDLEFDESMDNLLKEAREDLDKLVADDSDTLETSAPSADLSSLDDDGDDALADVAADLDAMMKQADAELAELLES